MLGGKVYFIFFLFNFFLRLYFGCIFSMALFLFHTVLYNRYLVPKNLTEDEEFLANDLVPTLLTALRKY